MSSRAVFAALSPDLPREAEELAAVRGAIQAVDLGVLPEWDLTDLYPSMDAPAFREDLDRAEAESRAFAERYAGRIAEIAAGPDASSVLGEAVQTFERIEDLMGRLMSYAGLVYSGDTTDETRAKFYGDTRERLTTASGDLLFFGLELNRVEDAVLDAAMADGPL
ncbi:MAG: oligoendopeptidase F, partial [Methylobacteriaceae bacterium]